MHSVLKEKLLAFITVNNPDLTETLRTDYGITTYLEDKLHSVMSLVSQLLTEGKPLYIIEELALNEMTAELRPSRFNYIKEVLETEFSSEYERFSEAGVLTYECINLTAHCKEVFESFEFNEENEDNRFLKYAIIGKVHDYLN
ncbi:DUF1896 family protein [Pedobacter frigoris]|uniref:DUF1896 family protein n=1 Tax=Pedobacter frigoris TaxID=2571272 RepID=UPI0029305ABD|nr:DUF1896 family protein [Pedobacter frigoris]